MNKDREYVKVNNKEIETLREILDLKDSKCSICSCNIKEDSKYSIFSKPTRIICSNIICLSKAMEDDE